MVWPTIEAAPVFLLSAGNTNYISMAALIRAAGPIRRLWPIGAMTQITCVSCWPTRALRR
jgi:hypothetical protein